MSTEDVVIAGLRPKGYSNGRIGRGRVLHIAGQVGWNSEEKFEHKDMLRQFAQALDNVLGVLKAASGTVADIAEMTVYVTDIASYRRIRKELGPVWRERMGAHFPAMALVAVSALLELDAIVEIQAVAYLDGE